MALALALTDELALCMPNIIGYVRVSDPSQLDSNSIEQQAAEIQKWATKRGYNVVAIYYDPGVSGAKLRERRGLIEAVQRAKADIEISGIVFFNFDRYFRDLGWSEMIRKSLAASGKQIFSTEQDLDLSNKYGVFTFQIQQAVAELKRKEIIELLHARRMAKGERGGWIGGRVPFGKKPQAGELVDDRDEQRCINYVRRLRKWVRPNGAPMTYGQICDYMNEKLEADIKRRGVSVSESPWAPKHAKPLLRKRSRPYAKKRPLMWTVNNVAAILRVEKVVFYPNVGRPRKNDQTTTKKRTP